MYLDANFTCTCNFGDACCGTNCRPLASSAVCRPSAGVCDLPEYCDGKSGFCPVGIYNIRGRREKSEGER